MIEEELEPSAEEEGAEEEGSEPLEPEEIEASAAARVLESMAKESEVEEVENLSEVSLNVLVQAALNAAELARAESPDEKKTLLKQLGKNIKELAKRRVPIGALEDIMNDTHDTLFEAGDEAAAAEVVAMLQTLPAGDAESGKAAAQQLYEAIKTGKTDKSAAAALARSPEAVENLMELLEANATIGEEEPEPDDEPQEADKEDDDSDIDAALDQLG